MEPLEVGQVHRSSENMKTSLEWDELDSLSVQATRLHRTLTELEERCSCKLLWLLVGEVGNVVSFDPNEKYSSLQSLVVRGR